MKTIIDEFYNSDFGKTEKTIDQEHYYTVTGILSRYTEFILSKLPSSEELKNAMEMVIEENPGYLLQTKHFYEGQIAFRNELIELFK